MSGICFPPDVVESFKKALVSGKINPGKLARMTSEERHALFSEVVGEGNAKFTNAQFETKLLLKDQQRGYLTWAKKLTGVSQTAKRDLISRIERMDKVLNPAEEKAFMKDLASTKLGVDVTVAEAKKIANMSTKLQKLEAKRSPDGTFKSETDRMAYGYAKVDLGKHLSDLKLAAGRRSVKQTLLSNPVEHASKIAGVAKSVRASLDNSAIFRQGWKTLWTNPIVWQRNARKSFSDLARVGFKNEDVQREVMADIVSRPNYEAYSKMKLALGNIEEEFPSSIQNKIPIAGRAFKASEAAYENFLYRTRADVADKYLEIAKAGGVDITDKKQLAAMGKVINSLTGRGSLGAGEGSKAVGTWTNNLFFSIRFLKSNIDVLTAHAAGKDMTAFARKQAATNLLKVVSGTAAVLTIANALHPGSVELDPRSSSFGKIKIKNTTFDITGGMGSLVVLAARQIKGQTKSANTGVVTDYGSGYGETSRADGFTDFITGKFSPAAAAVQDLMEGEDFDGNKPTAKSTAKNLFVPLPVANTVDSAKDPQSAPWLVNLITDGLGISTSNTTPKRNVSKDLTKTQEAFKSKVGEAKFNQANDDYNKQYNEWLASHKARLSKEPEGEKADIITYQKSRIQKEIYKKYGFKPSTKSNKSLLDKKKSYAN